MPLRSRLVLACIIAAPMFTLPVAAGETASHTATDNADRVRAAFNAWRAGTGSVFDLLTENAVWTIAGQSPVSGVHRSRQSFRDDAVRPIHARLATPIQPEITDVIAQGDNVVVIWEGQATTVGGDLYRNHYAWHMVFDGDRVVRVTAFLDTWALQQLMQ